MESKVARSESDQKSADIHDASLPALVSIITPVKNAEAWLDECFGSVVNQTYLNDGGALEISIFDDGSTDNSVKIITGWMKVFTERGIKVVFGAKVVDKPATAAGDSKSAQSDATSASKRFSLGLSAGATQLDVSAVAGFVGVGSSGSAAGAGAGSLSSAADSDASSIAAAIAAASASASASATESAAAVSAPVASPGAARNRAIRQSTGQYLCLLDADDIMQPERVALQLAAARRSENRHVIVGCNFTRTPEGSTARYTNWLNSLSDEELVLHQYRDLTMIQPTWFLPRAVYDRVGGYAETGKGTPEDLIFYYQHLRAGGAVCKVPKPLVVYRLTSGSWSFGVHRNTLLQVRLDHFQRTVLDKNERWKSFSIWGAGRDGKKFYKELREEHRRKVAAFLDIDAKKIGTVYADHRTKQKVPIIHFSKAVPPFVVCVALDRTDGELENNVKSLGLRQGVDYFFFN